MQIMLNALSMWCTENCMSINTSKSKLVHFRPQSIPKSEFVYKCGDDCIQYCSDHKYLGLVLNEFLDYKSTAKSVALSANRALGLVIAKCKILGGVSHGVFTKLYDSMVSSIVEYGASIWGTRNYSCINAMQNRACRFFLGVGKYTPNNAVSGHMGWEPIFHKQWKAVINLWCRLNNMSSDRLNRKLFVWADYIRTSNKCVKNWKFNIKKTFCELNVGHFGDIVDSLDTRFFC